jgi:putative heme-binding domain-containing protein
MDVTKPDVAARQNTEKEIKADYKTYKEDALQAMLKHPDMRVREKAQFELATRGDKGLQVFKAQLANKEHQLARVHSIWGISQFARKDINAAAWLVPYLSDSDPEIRAQAARWIGDVRYKGAGKQLIALLKDSYPRARFFAAEALGRTENADGVNPIIEMLAANNDEDNYLRHAGTLALARIGKAEPLLALSTSPNRALRIAAVVALRRLLHPGIRVFLKDADEFVVTETARAINDDHSILGALPDLANALGDHRFKNEAFIRRAISANLRVGTDSALQNLIAYINSDDAPAAMRSEAIDALSTWAKPSVLDRVDGRFRGEVNRDIKPVQKNAAESLIKLVTNKDAALREHAAKALGKLQVKEAAPVLLAQLAKDPAPEVRIALLKSLSKLQGANIELAIRTALADKEKQVRVVGLDLLGSLPVAKETVVALLDDVITNRTPEEKQAALTTLATFPLANTQKTLDKLLSQLEQKKLPNEVLFELSDAVDSSHSQALIDRYKKSVAALSSDPLKALYAGALSGGDPRKGAQIFWGHPNAQCLRCHSYSDYGGTAGPRLNGVASRLQHEQLLEAVIEPSARIAPGYGMVALDLNNKQQLNGILQLEKPDGYVLKIGDKPDTLIRKSDVAKKQSFASSMPQMTTLLTKKEIRDVVAFLSTLK